MGYITQESNNGFIFTNPDKMKKKSKRINRGK